MTKIVAVEQRGFGESGEAEAAGEVAARKIVRIGDDREQICLRAKNRERRPPRGGRTGNE